jgi:glycosyltransferase involved in cell wall biosynthesis
MSIQFSAIIPAYNAEKYLETCLHSLIRQESNLKEILIINDGSIDSTTQIALSWSNHYSHIKLLTNEKNCGVSFSRNKGIINANSDWVLLVDADDVIDDCLLEKHQQEIKRYHSQYGQKGILCFSSYEQIEADGKTIPGVFSFKEVAADEMLGYLFVRNNIYLSGTSFNKEAFLKAGMFNPEMTCNEDYDLWIRMAQHGGFVYIDHPLVKVRRHPGNASKRIQNMLDGERKILEKYDVNFIRDAIFRRNLPIEKNHIDFVSILFRLELYELARVVLEKLCRDYPKYASCHFCQGLLYLKGEKTKEAIKSFRNAVSFSPNHGAALNNLGAILSINGNKREATYYLKKALAIYPGYLDAIHNLTLCRSRIAIDYKNCRFTWRELRPVLLNYES